MRPEGVADDRKKLAASIKKTHVLSENRNCKSARNFIETVIYQISRLASWLSSASQSGALLPMLTPRFRFGSITGVMSASFSLSRGTSPSVCQVTVPYGKYQIETKPTSMTWTDGQRTVSFAQCVVNDVSAVIDGDGAQLLTLSIVDRRWKWKWYQISGRYNVRDAGVIRVSTKKNARELVKLILETMGETNYDIKQVPDDVWPHVDFDLVKAHAALDQVVKAVNCHVVLTHEDRVAIYPTGWGKDLPALPNSSRGISFNFASSPGKLTTTSGWAQWQLDFDLLAVGLDTDGQVKPIDELSYRPRNGWEKDPPPLFLNVKTKHRKLAQETVFKWYAIWAPGWVDYSDVDGRLSLNPRSGNAMREMPVTDPKLKLPIVSMRQFFPLLDHQLAYQSVSHADQKLIQQGKMDPHVRVRKPAQVIGVFYDGGGYGSDDYNEKIADQTKDDDSVEIDWVLPLVYPGGFTIDDRRGLVVFSDCVYRYFRPMIVRDGRTVRDVANTVIRPARIFLRTATNFRHNDTLAPWRLTKTKPIKNGPDPNLTEYFAVEDAIPEYRCGFNLKNFGWYFDSKNPSATNLKEIEERLDLAMDQQMKQYEIETPSNAVYPMLVPYAPDGQIAQVTWSIDSRGAMQTSISRQREELTNLPSYDERRQAIQLKNTLDTLARQSGRQDTEKKDGR